MAVQYFVYLLCNYYCQVNLLWNIRLTLKKNNGSSKTIITIPAQNKLIDIDSGSDETKSTSVTWNNINCVLLMKQCQLMLLSLIITTLIVIQPHELQLIQFDSQVCEQLDSECQQQLKKNENDLDCGNPCTKATTTIPLSSTLCLVFSLGFNGCVFGSIVYGLNKTVLILILILPDIKHAVHFLVILYE